MGWRLAVCPRYGPCQRRPPRARTSEELGRVSWSLPGRPREIGVLGRGTHVCKAAESKWAVSPNKTEGTVPLESSALPCVPVCVDVGVEPDVEGDNNRTYFIKQNLKIKEMSADPGIQMWKDLQGCAPCTLGLEHSPLGSLRPRRPMFLICLYSSPSHSCFPLVPGQK